jgi:hypothetical protein
MTARTLHEDHHLQQQAVPFAQRARKTLCKWMAPVAAAAALIAGALPAEASKQHNNPPPPPSISQQETQKEVFLFGEIHRHKPSANYVERYLPELKKNGYTDFAVELPKSIEKEFLELLNKPTRDTPISQNDGFTVNIPKEMIQVAKKAKALGMKIHCIDSDLSEKLFTDIEKIDKKFNDKRISEKEYAQGLESCFAERNQIMKKNLQQIPGKTAALVGAFHTGGPTGLDTLLKKEGVPTKTLDLLPTGGPLSVELMHTHQEKADIVVRKPEKGVKKEHLSLLEDFNLESLEALVSEANTKASEKPNKKERKKEDPKKESALLAQIPSL